jgi:hypothetical protein
MEQISNELMVEEHDDVILPTPETIIRANIEKANRLLDATLLDALNEPKDLDELDSIAKVDKLNSRRIEVIAKLIDSITVAAEKLITAENEGMGLLLRQDMLKLKERELLLKNERGSVNLNQQITQNNVIIKTREDLLKLIAEDTSIVEVKDITGSMQEEF